MFKYVYTEYKQKNLQSNLQLIGSILSYGGGTIIYIFTESWTAVQGDSVLRGSRKW